MQESEYKKLLIDVVKSGDNSDKDNIVTLLRLVTIRFEKTGDFTRHLWNHYKEYMYLCIPPNKMLELKTYFPYLEKVCYEIYEPNDEYELWGIEIKPGALPNDEEVSQDILFENIQREIIEEIRNAKYIIWIAMAWFTDPALFAELVKKSKQGVNIQLVIDDNEKNRKSSFNLSDNFETHWVSIQSLYKNIMHDKFCIIDLQTVIHGTYNWTLAAQYNKETISIDRNRETAELFANEFIKLKQNKTIS